jgi:superfamily II DNA helicase RecQ
MQLKFFRVLAGGPISGEGELNKFLRVHRVLTIDKQLVQGAGIVAYWSVAVEYMDSQSQPPGNAAESAKPDFKDILGEQDFALFCRLKDVRKSLADEAGVPVYSIFTNRHLADMAQKRCRDAGDIASIHGVGKKRAEKHSADFLKCIHDFENDGVAEPSQS